jgi:hypothetical protein
MKIEVKETPGVSQWTTDGVTAELHNVENAGARYRLNADECERNAAKLREKLANFRKPTREYVLTLSEREVAVVRALAGNVRSKTYGEPRRMSDAIWQTLSEALGNKGNSLMLDKPATIADSWPEDLR